jgi:AcrR family transcriptional regulator
MSDANPPRERDEVGRSLGDRILDAATRIFAVRGFDATAMHEISDDLGVSVAALYHHFPSKATILEAIVERGYRDVHDALDTCGTDRPAIELVECMIRQIVLSMHDAFEFATAARFDRPAIMVAMGERYRELRLEAVDRLEAALRAGQRAGTIRDDIDPKLTVRLLAGMWNWMPDWYVPDTSRRAVELADRFASIAIRGARGQRG